MIKIMTSTDTDPVQVRGHSGPVLAGLVPIFVPDWDENYVASVSNPDGNFVVKWKKTDKGVIVLLGPKSYARMYELEQKGAKNRTLDDRIELKKLRAKKAADETKMTEIKLKAAIGEWALKAVGKDVSEEKLSWIHDDNLRAYAMLLATQYRDSLTDQSRHKK